MSSFQNEGRRALYIRVNQNKWSSGHCLTSKIRELYLLDKSTTHTREVSPDTLGMTDETHTCDLDDDVIEQN
jgi:hypothetical protein